MLSRFTLALITLLLLALAAFAWALLLLYSGTSIPPAHIDWPRVLVDLMLSLTCFLLVAVAAYLPVRKPITAKLTIGFGLTFLGTWQGFLSDLVEVDWRLVETVMLSLTPIGLLLATLGLFQLGRAYRMSRLMLRSYQSIEENLATIDQLTQLHNRRYFFTVGTPKFAEAMDRGDSPLVVALRVNNLTALNQALGFEVGDEVLQRVGKAIRRYQEPDHLAARLGGRRFGILLPNGSRQQAEELVHQITTRVKHVVLTSNKGEELLTSIELEHQIGEPGPDEGLPGILRRIGSSPHC